MKTHAVLAIAVLVGSTTFAEPPPYEETLEVGHMSICPPGEACDRSAESCRIARRLLRDRRVEGATACFESNGRTYWTGDVETRRDVRDFCYPDDPSDCGPNNAFVCEKTQEAFCLR